MMLVPSGSHSIRVAAAVAGCESATLSAVSRSCCNAVLTASLSKHSGDAAKLALDLFPTLPIAEMRWVDQARPFESGTG